MIILLTKNFLTFVGDWGQDDAHTHAHDRAVTSRAGPAAEAAGAGGGRTHNINSDCDRFGTCCVEDSLSGILAYEAEDETVSVTLGRCRSGAVEGTVYS